jgi:hypothetical protein
MAADDSELPELAVGRVYTAEQLGEAFGFSPYYLRTAGGMVPVANKNSLLLITHPEQDASFEYGDYWDGDDLVYTGRGQGGDQTLTGANRDVAENRRTLWVFEHLGSYQRRFLGTAFCAEHWWAIAPDKDGNRRRVIRFCLRLVTSDVQPQQAERRARSAQRVPRPYDEQLTPVAPAPGVGTLTPEELAQLAEKANATHHRLLVELKRRLERDGWTDIEEIPAAVDLWARRSANRVIFEAKSIAATKELAQTRAGLAQLLEYRFFYGSPDDLLCLVTDVPLSDGRLRFLAAMGVHVLWFDGTAFRACGTSAGVLDGVALTS